MLQVYRYALPRHIPGLCSKSRLISDDSDGNDDDGGEWNEERIEWSNEEG